MLLDVVVYAGEVLLVEHAELDLLRLRGDDEVEGVAEHGGVGYAVDGGEVEEGEGLFEAVEDADGGEEQIAWFRMLVGLFDVRGLLSNLLCSLCAL